MKKKVKKSEESTGLMHSNFYEKEFEGLVSFEEISSYKILKPSFSGKRKRIKCIQVNGHKQKKNDGYFNVDSAPSLEANNNDDDLINNDYIEEKETKKKKRKLKPNTKDNDNNNDDNLINDDCIEENETKKKKRKLKPTTKENDNNYDDELINDGCIEENQTKKKKRKLKPDTKDNDDDLINDDCIEEKETKKKKRKLKPIAKDNDSDLSLPKKGDVDEKDFNVDCGEWHSIFTPEPVLKAIAKLGFSKPTEIQKLTIPSAIKDRRDIVGAAETGSGKTLAFGIPIISGILYDRKKEEENKDSDMPGEEESDVEVDERNKDDMENMVDLGEELNMENDQDDDDDELQSDNDELQFDNNELQSDNGMPDIGMSDIGMSDIENRIGCVKVIDDINDNDFMKSLPAFPKNKLRALIITPTRELAMQIKDHLDAILSETNIKTAGIIGGMAHVKQQRVLKKGPEIVIGTPGRLWELYQEGNPHLSQIPDIDYLAIDETDRMMEKGHFDELGNILQLLSQTKKRQTFIFSATLTMTHQAPKRVKNKDKKQKEETKESKLKTLFKLVGIKGKPKIVDITWQLGTVETLSEARIYCEKEEKDQYLYYFLSAHPGRTLVFCNSVSCVKRLNNLLNVLQCKPLSLHAMKHQKQRLKSLEKFASSSVSVLLATDVAARGLDIKGIDHILHYEVPKTAETYVHRSGRTARATMEGLSVILVEPGDMYVFRHLCSTLNKNQDLPPFPVNLEIFTQVKSRVTLARSIETAEYRKKKKTMDNDWLKQLSKEAGIDYDEVLSDDEASSLAMDRKKTSREVANYRGELKNLLAKPFIQRGASLRYPTHTGKFVNPTQIITSSALDLAKQEKSHHLSRLKNLKPTLNLKKERHKHKKEKKDLKKKNKKKFYKNQEL